MFGLPCFQAAGLSKSHKFIFVFISRKLAQVINGRKIANNVLDTISERTKQWPFDRIPPSLAVVLVGDDASSVLYVNNKTKAANRSGIKSETFNFPSTISETELVNVVRKLNTNKQIDGILVQLPLPDHICKETICETISPEKDVDGFTSVNFGKFCLGLDNAVVPCTPLAVAHLIHSIGLDTRGKNAVVCGRSKHVGLPIALLLQSSFCKNEQFEFNATTTICHRHTPHQVLSTLTEKADIIVSATGVPELIRGCMVKKGAVVIDVGITRTYDESSTKTKFVGDVCFEEVKEVASYITPVPGGVGPLTVAMLMKNTLSLAIRRREKFKADDS